MARHAGSVSPPRHMMGRQSYTDEQKAEALSLYVDLGVAETARRTGINPLTISSWARRAGLHTNAATKTKEATEVLIARAAEMREELRVRMLHKALDMLDRMDAPHIEFKGKDATPVTYPIAPAPAVQAYATSAAIMLDKYRLEVGEATEVRRDLTDKFDDHEKLILGEAIRGELARRADERVAEATVGPAGKARAEGSAR